MPIDVTVKIYKNKVFNRWECFHSCTKLTFNKRNKTFSIQYESSGVAIRHTFPYDRLVDVNFTNGAE